MSSCYTYIKLERSRHSIYSVLCLLFVQTADTVPPPWHTSQEPFWNCWMQTHYRWYENRRFTETLWYLWTDNKTTHSFFLEEWDKGFCIYWDDQTKERKKGSVIFFMLCSTLCTTLIRVKYPTLLVSLLTWILPLSSTSLSHERLLKLDRPFKPFFHPLVILTHPPSKPPLSLPRGFAWFRAQKHLSWDISPWTLTKVWFHHSNLLWRSAQAILNPAATPSKYYLQYRTSLSFSATRVSN